MMKKRKRHAIRSLLRAIAIAHATALALLVLAVPAAAATGPGYGGTADGLSITVRHGGRSDQLMIDAVGFAALSEVHVRVGTAYTAAAQSDEIGVLRFVAPVTATGLSVRRVTVTGVDPDGRYRVLHGQLAATESTGHSSVIVGAAGFLCVAVGGRLRRLKTRSRGKHRRDR